MFSETLNVSSLNEPCKNYKVNKKYEYVNDVGYNNQQAEQL